jgi:WD40 repeat protein
MNRPAPQESPQRKFEIFLRYRPTELGIFVIALILVVSSVAGPRGQENKTIIVQNSELPARSYEYLDTMTGNTIPVDKSHVQENFPNAEITGRNNDTLLIHTHISVGNEPLLLTSITDLHQAKRINTIGEVVASLLTVENKVVYIANVSVSSAENSSNYRIFRGLYLQDVNMDTPKELVKPESLANFISTFAISPDGKWVAYTSQDLSSQRVSLQQPLKVIDLEGNEVFRDDVTVSEPNNMLWFPDGEKILIDSEMNRVVKATNDRPIPRAYIFSLKDRSVVELPIPTKSMRSPVIAPDGKGFFYEGSERDTGNTGIYFYDISQQKAFLLGDITFTDVLHNLTISPDGKMLTASYEVREWKKVTNGALVFYLTPSSGEDGSTVAVQEMKNFIVSVHQ